MTAKEVRVFEEAMTGTILIGYVPAFVLFDSDISHYFTLSAFIIQQTIPYTTLDSRLNINTRNGIITL